MKNACILFFCVLGSFWVSCQDELETSLNGVSTRVIVDGSNVSVTNPQLLNDWENVQTIVLNVTPEKKVTSPWFDGAESHLPSDFCMDIKKEDGWKILFHTFKDLGLDEGQNYICFYNQFTGYVKVFYYYDSNNPSQGTQWYVSTGNSEKTHLLSLSDYIAEVDTAKAEHSEILCSNQTGVPTTGLNPGWNGFEFEVPYCTDYRNINFIIGAYDNNIVNYDFIGKEEAKTVGTITTNSQSSSGLVSAIANLAGNEAKNLVSSLTKKANLGSTLTNLISLIPGAGYAKAISAGLGLIFGRSTSTTSDIKLSTSGTITLGGSGTSQTTNGVHPISFNLYQILNPTVGGNPSNSNSLVYNAQSPSTNEHFIGVWGVRNTPWVVYERFTQLKNAKWTGPNSVAGKVSSPRLINYQCIPFGNPDISQYITECKSTIKFIRCDTLQGQVYKKNIKDIGSFSSNKYTAELLYKDEYNCFYESGNVCELSISGLNPFSTVENKTFWYDWGIILDGRLLAVVTRETTFSYLGKNKTVTQSRVYDVGYNFDACYVDDYNAWYNAHGTNNAVINDHEPAFGIFIEEKDLPLYGK